jgi:hypothetical protein
MKSFWDITPYGLVNISLPFGGESGYAVAQLVEALRHKAEGRRFDSLLYDFNFL